MDSFAGMFVWVEHHIGATIALAIGWVLMLVVTLWAGHWFLLSIPADYFVGPHQPLEFLARAHPVLRWSVLVAKNLLGALLVIAGIIMLFTPGQGILAIILGASLLDIPGKRIVERWIIGQPRILKAVNHMRAKAGRSPLELEPSRPTRV